MLPEPKTPANRIGPSGEDWLQIVRGEYLEIPGLQLTRPQVRRLWGLDEQVCSEVLDALMGEGFLRLTADGRYVRSSSAGLSVVRGSREPAADWP